MRFRTAAIGDIASVQTGPFGSQLHNKDYVIVGTPIVTVEHLGQRKMTRQNLPCVSDKDKERLSKYTLECGDLVFSRVGSVDRCSWVSEEENGWMFSGRCLRVRPNDPSEIYHKYLYYFFNLESTKQFVRNVAVGATMPSINTRLLSEVPIVFPCIEEQWKIGDTLSALDDLFEANTKMNRHLEQMAQAIFKSWFVDFEPWGGEQPKDWREVPLGDLVQSIDNRGKTPPLAMTPTDYPVIDVKALSGNHRVVDFNNCTKFVEAETYHTWFRSGHPKPYDILLSTVGSLAEMKLFFGNRGCIAQNVVGLRSKMPLYLYQYLQYIKDDLISYNIGSVQPSIKVTHIIKHSILVPVEDVLLKFNEVVQPMTEKIYENHCQSEYLAALRDTLLPRLMSGEIQVPLEV